MEKSAELCYEIKQSEELGRYIIAKRDISPLEVVIREKPLCCAPADDHNFEDLRSPMCLGCFARIPANSPHSSCSKCGWPVCDNECEMISHHSGNECKYFAEQKISYKPLPYQHLLNETIFILRCLLLKQRDETIWTDVVLRFEHHTEVRNGKAECVEKDEKIIANFTAITNQSNSTLFNFDEGEIIKISGIINVNAFSSTKFEDEYRSRRVRRRVTICQCLYPTATLLAHQCIPNASWSVSASPAFEQTIRSTIFIKKGEMISIAYAPQEIMWPTLQRLISSNDVAHFICLCHRCKDPSELGTLIGAIKCQKCVSLLGSQNEKRYLLPADSPTNVESQWKCQNPDCNATKSVEEVVKIVHKIENKFNRIKSSMFSAEAEVEELEELYEDSLANYLYSNHYLLLEISLRIMNRKALSVYCLNLEELDRFLFHCNFLLNIYSVLSPGYCRARALVQFYSSQAKMVQARKLTKNREITKLKIQEIYEPIYELQKEAFLYFKAEDENDNRYRKVKGFNQYVACLEEEMKECLKAMQIEIN